MWLEGTTVDTPYVIRGQLQDNYVWCLHVQYKLMIVMYQILEMHIFCLYESSESLSLSLYTHSYNH